MSERFVMNEDIFEKAITILENRSFMEKQDSKKILFNGLCQIEHFKTLMRDTSLQHHLYPYLEEFAQQVTYKPIPKGRIIFHDGDSISNLYFVMRGSFVEFQPKSQQDYEKELYWSSQAGQQKEQLTQVQKSQFELQEKKKMQIFELQRLQSNQQKQNYNQDSSRGDTTTQTAIAKQNSQQQTQKVPQIQQSNTNSNSQEKRPAKRGKGKEVGYQPRKSGSLEDIFFTDEFKEKSQKLKSMSELYVETTKYYQGKEYENLLKIENKNQERYFRENRCVYKKSHVYSAGMCFGELHDQIGETTQITKKQNIIGSTIVCNENSFLLSMSCKTYQRIFEKLTERINFVFHVLANSFQSVKKVILHEFAFQFSEQSLEFNELLFRQGELCNYVYIMKAGEIDYRKQVNINGEFHEKRIGMINQGEIFGHEDLFNLSRAYSVHSCVNNSIVYRIKKDLILISQFMAPLKAAVKQKSDYLSKRFQELYWRNGEIAIEDQELNESKKVNRQQKDPFITHNQEKGGNTFHQVLFKLDGNQSNQHHKMSNMAQSLRSIPSLGHIPSNTNFSNSHFPPSLSKTLQNLDGGQNLFYNAKNTNFGENDYNLTFKSQSKLELLHSNSNLQNKNTADSQNSTTTGGGQDRQKGKQKSVINIVQTTRAQPESVYSRIIRPDSAFKEEIDQMKKEQAAQLLQFNSNDNYSQSGLQDVSGSFKILSLNRFKREDSQKNQFKINKMPKEMFSLQIAINSDEKLKKKQTIKNLKAEEQNTIDKNSNNHSNSISPLKQQLKRSDNFSQAQLELSQMPRGTTTSLIRYKEQAKDYFVKDNKPKQLDFFLEFQNYRQAVQAQQLYEKQNKNEIKDDPYSHIDFNVVSNVGSTPQSQVTSQSEQTNANQFNTQLSSYSNRNLLSNTKSISILKNNSELKKGYSENTVKSNISSNYPSKNQQYQLNNNYLKKEVEDEEFVEGSHDNPISNQYNSVGIKSTSFILEQYPQNNKYLPDSNQRSQSREMFRRSLSNTNTHRKIHFSNTQSINQYQVNSKISQFNKGNQNQLNSNFRKNNNDEESAPLQLRDIPLKNKQIQSFNNKSDTIQNQQQSNLYQQSQEAEADLDKNFSNALSFGNLRKANGLSLGAQLYVPKSKDMKQRK